MSRREAEAVILRAVTEHFDVTATAHFNWGDSHRRMLLYNRRHERAFQRSRRNQPPRRSGR
jgi:hypothetical protein